MMNTASPMMMSRAKRMQMMKQMPEDMPDMTKSEMMAANPGMKPGPMGTAMPSATDAAKMRRFKAMTGKK